MVWGTCYKGAKPEVIVLLKSRISSTKCTETLATNLREKSPLYAGQCRINQITRSQSNRECMAAHQAAAQ